MPPRNSADLGIPSDNRSYRAQILRGVKKAPKDGVKISSWHPNQVRHTAANEITAQLGPAAAQARLGHSHLNTTEIYRSQQVAEVDRIASVLNVQPQRSTTACIEPLGQHALNDAAICRALSRRCQLSNSVLRPLLPTAQTAYQAGMGGIRSDLRTTFLRLDSMAILHTSRIVAADGG